MNKEVNVYSFNDECYVYLGDYKKLEQENNQLKTDLEDANESIVWWESRFNAISIENNQLKKQRQELRSWLEEYVDYSDCIKIYSVLNKLNELEGGKNE